MPWSLQGFMLDSDSNSIKFIPTTTFNNFFKQPRYLHQSPRLVCSSRESKPLSYEGTVLSFTCCVSWHAGFLKYSYLPPILILCHCHWNHQKTKTEVRTSSLLKFHNKSQASVFLNHPPDPGQPTSQWPHPWRKLFSVIQQPSNANSSSAWDGASWAPPSSILKS